MEISIVVILLLVGIAFILLELFIIPGFSLAGITGIVSMISAVVYAYSSVGSAAGHITLLGGLILAGISIWIFLKSKTLEKMALNTEIDSKVDPLEDSLVQVGDTGKTISRLAPMGKIRVNGHDIEAKTNDDFIDENTEIKVVKVMNTNVLVERISLN